MSRQHREAAENLTDSELMAQLQAAILIAVEDAEADRAAAPRRVAPTVASLTEFFNSSGESEVSRNQVYRAAVQLSIAGKVTLNGRLVNPKFVGHYDDEGAVQLALHAGSR